MLVVKKRIRSEEDLLSLKDTWTRLETGAGMTVFQSFEWNRLLLKEWLGWKLHDLYSEVHVYTAAEESAPVMLLPVIVYRFSTETKWFGCKKGIYLLGQGSYSDYMDAVCLSFDPTAFEALVSALRADFPGLPITLSSVREDSRTAAYLTARGAAREVSTVSLSVKRLSDPDEYRASLSAKTRSNLRQAERRMSKDNMDYRLEIVGPVDDPALIKEMVDIHVKRMLTKNTKHDGFLHVMSSYVRKAYRKYRDLHNNIIAMSMRENQKSVLVLIRLNGRLVGYDYGLREPNAIRLLQTCFDEEYKFYSPLFRGMYDFIVGCYEDESILEVDLTRGGEEYKYKLGGQEMELFDFTF